MCLAEHYATKIARTVAEKLNFVPEILPDDFAIKPQSLIETTLTPNERMLLDCYFYIILDGFMRIRAVETSHKLSIYDAATGSSCDLKWFKI